MQLLLVLNQHFQVMSLREFEFVLSSRPRTTTTFKAKPAHKWPTSGLWAHNQCHNGLDIGHNQGPLAHSKAYCKA